MRVCVCDAGAPTCLLCQLLCRFACEVAIVVQHPRCNLHGVKIPRGHARLLHGYREFFPRIFRNQHDEDAHRATPHEHDTWQELMRGAVEACGLEFQEPNIRPKHVDALEVQPLDEELRINRL